MNSIICEIDFFIKKDNTEIICEKHDEIISMICMSDDCLNNLFCNDCIKDHNQNHIKYLKNIKGKSFKNEILQTNSLIEKNIIKITKICDIFNENMKYSIDLLDLRIKLTIEEITKHLNDHRNQIMKEYEKELIGNLDLRNLNFPKLIKLEEIKNLVKNIKDAEIFMKGCSKYDEIKLKSQKMRINLDGITIRGIKEWIKNNVRRIDNIYEEDIHRA